MESERIGMNEALTINLIWLSCIKGVGKVAMKEFAEICEKRVVNPTSSFQIRDILLDIKDKNSRITVPEIYDIDEAQIKRDQLLSGNERMGVRCMNFYSDLYPRLYRTIDNPPILLYFKGDPLSFESNPNVAIIGTREPSDRGRKIGRKLSEYFAKSGFTIVSGLALGCDTIAHEAALSHKSRTVAILAGGLDKIYPKENMLLAERIVDHGGALLSEYPVGQSPRQNTFVERDRLQSGLSLGTVVIQTGITGGTHHTAKFTKAQKRLLACIKDKDEFFEPDPKYHGNRALILDGAIPLNDQRSIDDFILKLKNRGSHTLDIDPLGKDTAGRGAQLNMFE